MSKQLEAELRAAKTEADAAVDAAMVILESIAEAAKGARVMPQAGLLDTEIEPATAVLRVHIPLNTMLTSAEARNLWRRSKDTVQ